MRIQGRILTLLSVASLLWISTMPAAAQNSNGIAARPIRTPHVGVASWYGAQHQGLPMANGQRFDRYKLTAASWYFPLGTKVRVVNRANGKSVLVTITDRGPNPRLKTRIIDLSQAAAARLGYIHQGLTPVFLFPVIVVAPEEAEITAHLAEPHSKEASLSSALLPINKPQEN